MEVVQAHEVERSSKRALRLMKRNEAKLLNVSRQASAKPLPRIEEDNSGKEMNPIVCFILLMSLFILVWAKQQEKI